MTAIANTMHGIFGLMYAFLAYLVYMWPNAFAAIENKKEFTHRELLLSGKCWAYRGVLALLVLAFAVFLGLYFYVWAFIICFHVAFWLNDFLLAHGQPEEVAIFWSMMSMGLMYMFPILVFALWPHKREA